MLKYLDIIKVLIIILVYLFILIINLGDKSLGQGT